MRSNVRHIRKQTFGEMIKSSFNWIRFRFGTNFFMTSQEVIQYLQAKIVKITSMTVAAFIDVQFRESISTVI
jgi:hypothetical protein